MCNGMDYPLHNWHCIRHGFYSISKNQMDGASYTDSVACIWIIYRLSATLHYATSFWTGSRRIKNAKSYKSKITYLDQSHCIWIRIVHFRLVDMFITMILLISVAFFLITAIGSIQSSTYHVYGYKFLPTGLISQ